MSRCRPFALFLLGLLPLACAGSCADEDPAVCQGDSCGGGGEGGTTPELECPESGVLYGPWSLRFDETSISVRWDGCKPHPTELQVEPEAGGQVHTFTGEQTAADVQTSYAVLDAVAPDLPGVYYRTEVVVTGLEPGTCYRYVVAAEPERSGRFCTARPSGESFTFLAIGDTNPGIGDTAGVLNAVLGSQPDFVIHVGDIQLYASLFDSWAAWFPAMAPMFRQGAFMPSIGNHEYEIDFEFTDYYERLFGGAGFDGTVDYYRFQSGGVWFFSLNKELPLGPGSEQAIWLEQQLADAAARPGFRCSIVYFHQPFITLADYSQDVSAREHFRPIFLQHQVRLVMQGHVHGYERFVDGELIYVTTGGGGAALHDLDARIDERPEEAALQVASEKRYHATLIAVTPTELTATAISNTAEVLDEFTIAVP